MLEIVAALVVDKIFRRDSKDTPPEPGLKAPRSSANLRKWHGRPAMNHALDARATTKAPGSRPL